MMVIFFCCMLLLVSVVSDFSFAGLAGTFSGGDGFGFEQTGWDVQALGGVLIGAVVLGIMFGAF